MLAFQVMMTDKGVQLWRKMNLNEITAMIHNIHEYQSNHHS